MLEMLWGLIVLPHPAAASFHVFLGGAIACALYPSCCVSMSWGERQEVQITHQIVNWKSGLTQKLDGFFGLQLDVNSIIQVYTTNKALIYE